MPRYLFSFHDGFGLGHVKRNGTIGRALLAVEPDAEVTLVTGVAHQPRWLGDDPRLRLVAVPPLIKDLSGAYRNGELSFEEALRQRAAIFERTVADTRPDVVVVDRHPYGTAGELRPGLEAAVARGPASCWACVTSSTSRCGSARSWPARVGPTSQSCSTGWWCTARPCCATTRTSTASR